MCVCVYVCIYLFIPKKFLTLLITVRDSWLLSPILFPVKWIHPESAALGINIEY